MPCGLRPGAPGPRDGLDTPFADTEQQGRRRRCRDIGRRTDAGTPAAHTDVQKLTSVKKRRLAVPCRAVPCHVMPRRATRTPNRRPFSGRTGIFREDDSRSLARSLARLLARLLSVTSVLSCLTRPSLYSLARCCSQAKLAPGPRPVHGRLHRRGSPTHQQQQLQHRKKTGRWWGRRARRRGQVRGRSDILDAAVPLPERRKQKPEQ